MKTKFFKMVLPMLAILFALAFAVQTNAKSENGLKVIKTGYLQHPGEVVECEAVENCSTVLSANFCRVGQLPANPRLWDMNAQSKCTVALYKP